MRGGRSGGLQAGRAAVVVLLALVVFAGLTAGEGTVINAAPEWSRRFGGAGTGGELDGSATANTDGGVFVATSHVTPSGAAFSVRRLDASGHLVWRRRVEGASSPVVASDHAGGVVVAARMLRPVETRSGGDAWHIVVRRLDSDGRLVGQRVLRGFLGGDPTGIIVEPGGDCTIVGYSRPAGEAQRLARTRVLAIRLNGHLQVQWARRLSAGGGDTVGSSIAPVGDGVVIAGTVYPRAPRSDSDQRNIGTRMFTARLSDTGTVRWVRQWIGGASMHPRLRAAAAQTVTVKGHSLFVGGYAGVYTDHHADDDTDGVVLRYTLGGRLDRVDYAGSRLADELIAGAATRGGVVFAGRPTLDWDPHEYFSRVSERMVSFGSVNWAGRMRGASQWRLAPSACSSSCGVGPRAPGTSRA